MRNPASLLIFCLITAAIPSCASFNDVGRPAGGSTIAQARELKQAMYGSKAAAS
jgi:hypothetical protein